MGTHHIDELQTAGARRVPVTRWAGERSSAVNPPVTARHKAIVLLETLFDRVDSTPSPEGRPRYAIPLRSQDDVAIAHTLRTDLSAQGIEAKVFPRSPRSPLGNLLGELTIDRTQFDHFLSTPLDLPDNAKLSAKYFENLGDLKKHWQQTAASPTPGR